MADAGPDPSGPGIWRLGPCPRYSQRVTARAREKLGVRECGRTVETRPISIPSAPLRPPQLQGSLRCKAKGAFAQGTGRNSARKRKKKKKNPAGLQRRPASRPKQQPRSARASHSPTRRCCASTAGAGTTTAARSGPAPTTPRTRPFAAPPPSPPTSLIPPGSLRVFAIFFPFVFGHACGVKL